MGFHFGAFYGVRNACRDGGVVVLIEKRGGVRSVNFNRGSVAVGAAVLVEVRKPYLASEDAKIGLLELRSLKIRAWRIESNAKEKTS
jgi:hypothetical protein